MNKKIMMWVAVMALVSGPALSSRAQEGPGGDEEAGMSQDGPGRPEMGPGMDREQMMKSRKMMRGGPGMGGPGFMSEEDTIAIIKKNDPDFAKRVEDLRGTAPAKYKMLLQMSGKLLGMARMQQEEGVEKDAVRMISLEFDTRELSLRYDKASDADKKAIKDALRGKLGELFDLKNRAQELRVKHMEKEMARLRKNLDNRKLNKDKIVQQRLDQMTGEGYGW